jgi:penicillin-binding protein A
VKTTINSNIQQAAVGALAGQIGGVAVLDARNGEVRALAGQAFSTPVPPGSTYKIITTVAALEAQKVALDDTFEVTDSTVVGHLIYNAHHEQCGGTFEQAFAHSCNTVFAPLGPKIGNDKMVEVAEKFGFNQKPQLFNKEATGLIDPPASTIPQKIGDEDDLADTAIGQGKLLATPLELATMAQTIAAGGIRSPTPITTDPELAPDAKPVQVTSRKIAGILRTLMIEVVTGGTGSAAALPGKVQVAGKTGTAELGIPKEPEKGGQPKQPQIDPDTGKPFPPEQKVDAWFTSFAPAQKPRLVVAVMLVDADGDGGEVAAPIAREILGAALLRGGGER